MLTRFRKIYFGLLVLIFPVLAQATGTGMVSKMKKTAGDGGFDTTGDGETKLSEIVGIVISSFLGLLGVIFIVLIIYSGYNWMTAGGDSDKVQKAKNTLSQAVIGLILVVSAYGIWDFIYWELL